MFLCDAMKALSALPLCHRLGKQVQAAHRTGAPAATFYFFGQPQFRKLLVQCTPKYPLVIQNAPNEINCDKVARGGNQ